MKNKGEPSSSNLGDKGSLKAYFMSLFLPEMPYFCLFSKNTDMRFPHKGFFFQQSCISK